MMWDGALNEPARVELELELVALRQPRPRSADGPGGA